MESIFRKSKVVAVLLLMLSLSMLNTACGKKSKNEASGPVVPTPISNQQIVDGLVAPGGDCPGCLQEPGFVMAALGKNFAGIAPDYKRFELALDFYGETSLGADPQNAAAACSYTGPMVGVGNFHVVNADDPGLCGLLPGRYAVHTSSIGQFARGAGNAFMGVIQGMTLKGTHAETGRSVTIDLVTSQINGTCDVEGVRAQGIDGSFRFALENQIAITAVNGQPCGSTYIIESGQNLPIQ